LALTGFPRARFELPLRISISAKASIGDSSNESVLQHECAVSQTGQPQPESFTVVSRTKRPETGKRGRALIIDILFNVFQIRLIPILLAINFQRGTRQEAICSGEWFGDGDEDNTTLRERRRRVDASVTRKSLCDERRPPLTPAILDL
jgi:hypothetical protein